ncbi:MAG: hypothetical protein R2706_10560 [Acidimicrobiales bacterium]
MSFGSLLSGAVIGLAISQLTVIATCLRSTRITIVRAIKDIGEAPRLRSRRRSLALGGVGLAVGAAIVGLAFGTQAGALLGPVVVVVSAIPILALVLPRRLATIVGCGAGIAWSAAVFGLVPDTMADTDVGVFLGQGVALVALASIMAANLDNVWQAVASRVSGGSVAGRLGLAHPLDRPVRSVMLVAMFAIVLFTVAFMSVLNAVFSAQGPELASRAGGGYSVIVDTNPSSAFSAAELSDYDGIERVAPIIRSVAAVELSDGTPATPENSATDDWPMSFITPEFTAVDLPSTTARLASFATDQAAWDAVAAGPAEDGTIWTVAPDDVDVVPGDSVSIVGHDGRRLDASGRNERATMAS